MWNDRGPIVTDVLEFARSHQEGRVTDEVTSVTFTEGWFRTSDLYDLNRDGDVLAEDDLFDDLDRIEYLRQAGHTQAEVGEQLGWSRSKVSQYTTLLSNVATQVLEIARSHQKGRVADSATSVAKFSEGWFRKSDLYDLNRDGDVLAEDDLFDDLDRVENLADRQTQTEIAEILGDEWSRSKVAKHSTLLGNIVPGVLDLARSHQEGRGTQDVPVGTFSERWFRDSGLYELNRDGRRAAKSVGIVW